MTIFSSFLALFDKIWKQQKAVEAYLMDSSCSFILFNESGQSMLFFVCNDEDFKVAYEIAEDAEVSDKVLTAIQARKSFPVKRKREAYLNVKNENWEESMLPVNQISEDGLYYALV